MKLYIKIFLVMCVGFTSCNDDYLERFPLDSPSSATFPTSDDELVFAVNGAYQGLYFDDMASSWHFQTNLVWEYYTDIASGRGDAYSWGQLNNSVTPESDAFVQSWTHYYANIQRCNFIIGNSERAKENIDEALVDRAEAEARFIRALNYTYLTELFGDVPLVTTTQSLDEAKLPRTAKTIVVDQIIEDLDFAALNLPDAYQGGDIGRATEGAALALKARVALYNEKFDVAISAAKDVIKLGEYGLFPNYEDLFQIEGVNNNESIFQLNYHLDVNANRANVYLNSRNAVGWSISCPTQWLVDSYLCTDGKPIDQSPLFDPAKPFENRDPRLKQSLLVPGVWHGKYLFETHPDSVETWKNEDGVLSRVKNLESTNPYATYTGYLWHKLSDQTIDVDRYTGGEMPLKLIRYAEVLLTLAEAKVEQNQIDADFFDAMNAIRSRAGMPDVEAGLSQDKYRKIVRNERKIELAGEGFRLFDIRRWKIAEHVLNGKLPGRKYKETWFTGVPVINEYGHPVYANQEEIFKTIAVRMFDASKAYLWPIPQKEIDVNDQLVQNPNW